MPEVSAAGWLLAALLAPALVWWLHRLRGGRRVRRVAAAYLWQAPAPDAAARGRPRPRARGPWRRRAAALACLCLALAGPLWPGDAVRPISVWVDDSASMHVLEAQGSRLEIAARALADALAERPPGPVTLHALGSPGRRLALAPGEARAGRILAWLRAPGADPPATPQPPAPAALAAAETHWLVSDGADPDLAAWAARAPIARVLRVGARSANSGLVRIALRPSLARPGTLAGLVTARNAGPAAARRRLVVRAGDRTLLEATLDLAPGASETRAFALAAPATLPVTARLAPADALAVDDALALHAAPATLPVTMAPACGRTVRAAVAAHPALAPGTAGGRGLGIHCGPDRPRTGPALWFRSAGTRAPLRAPLAWHGHPALPGPAHPDLAPAMLRRSVPATSGADPSAGVILSDAGGALVLAHGGGVVEVRLDMDWPPFAGRPVAAALFARLADAAAGTALLAPVAAATRPPAALGIAPGALPPATPPAAAAARHGAVDLTVPAALAAALLILADLLAGAARRAPGGGTPAP